MNYDEDIRLADEKYEKMKKEIYSPDFKGDVQWAREELDYLASICSIARIAKAKGW
jgi:hypothetical protein